MKAKVDPALCTACELCVQTCPEVFRMEGDTAVAYADPVPSRHEESVKEAANDCPAEAISVS
ncbi:MAG: ferredoxin [Spirochaetes bacterium]|nr:ferredoxin [Spirochaetota bacterium]